MLAGELYLATDPQLVAEDLRAQELLFRFNLTRPAPTMSAAHCWLSYSGVRRRGSAQAILPL